MPWRWSPKLRDVSHFTRTGLHTHAQPQINVPVEAATVVVAAAAVVVAAVAVVDDSAVVEVEAADASVVS